MSSDEWEIPTDLQPDPSDLSYELDQALRAVVGVKALIPEDGFTAGGLGTERSGSGVVINAKGLVLTIGYLVTEAETIWLTTVDGRAVPGHALAVDFETGFGLVQALGRLDLPPLEVDTGAGPRPGAKAVLASAGGRRHALRCNVVARQEFAGYWEYALDSAIFTAPAHPSWGGAALILESGKLGGIGSLVMQQQDNKGRRTDLNMVVPIGLLPPILADLTTYGRVNRPARPWLGMYAAEDDEAVVVSSLARGGPAQKAGVREGDRVVAVGATRVSDLGQLWRAVWESGQAGNKVRLTLLREDAPMEVTLTSADRSSFLKAPRLH